MGSQLHADLILYNGPIYTAYGQPYVDGLAVRQGRIVAVGDSSALEGLRGADTRAIDLEGRLALPAFNDCHLHMAMFGRSLSELDLGSQHVRSIREALDEIRKRAAAAKPGEWITGGALRSCQVRRKATSYYGGT
ncbi:amidohydrolase family protein [Ensifer adhaerens]